MDGCIATLSRITLAWMLLGRGLCWMWSQYASTAVLANVSTPWSSPFTRQNTQPLSYCYHTRLTTNLYPVGVVLRACCNVRAAWCLWLCLCVPVLCGLGCNVGVLAQVLPRRVASACDAVIETWTSQDPGSRASVTWTPLKWLPSPSTAVSPADTGSTRTPDTHPLPTKRTLVFPSPTTTQTPQ
jgi:hypothetical protein